MIPRLRDALRKLEGDPATIYKAHRFMARAWIICGIVTIPVVIFAPVLWAKVGVLLIAELSYYANWTGDQGAMSAADAATSESITAYAAENERKP